MPTAVLSFILAVNQTRSSRFRKNVAVKIPSKIRGTYLIEI